MLNVSPDSMPWLVSGFVFAMLVLLGFVVVIGHNI